MRWQLIEEAEEKPYAPASTLVVCSLLPTSCTQRRDAAVDQLLGVRVGDDDRAGRARRQRVENGRHQVRYATRPLQEADDFTFIVGNGEFIEGAERVPTIRHAGHALQQRDPES